MEVKQGSIGSEGAYDIKFEDGKVKISVSYNGDQMGASLSFEVPIKVYLDKLAAAIPGELDDAVLKALEAAIGI